MKPTLLQTLLNQPSRSYSTPKYNTYATSSSDPSSSKRSSFHSIQDFHRFSTVSRHSEEYPDATGYQDSISNKSSRRRSLKRVSWAVESLENSQDKDAKDQPAQPAPPPSFPHRPPIPFIKDSEISNHKSLLIDDADVSASLIPVTPVKDNIAMRHPTEQVRQFHPSLHSPSSSLSSLHRSTDLHSHQQPQGTFPTPSSSDIESSEEDLFYTPLSSPRTSKVESSIEAVNYSPADLSQESGSAEENMFRHVTSKLSPQPRLPPPASLPSTDIPASKSLSTSNTSTMTAPSSVASTDGDAYSDYSWNHRSSESNTSYGTQSRSSSFSKQSSSRARNVEPPRRRSVDVPPSSSSTSLHSNSESTPAAKAKSNRRSNSVSSTNSSNGKPFISLPSRLQPSDTWAKDVRWLVQPEEMTKPRSSGSSSSGKPRQSSKRSSSVDSQENLDKLLGLDTSAGTHPSLSVRQRAQTGGSNQPRPRQRTLSSQAKALTEAEIKRMSAVLEVDETNDVVIGSSSRYPSGRPHRGNLNVRRSRTFSEGSRDRRSTVSRASSTTSRTVDIPTPLPVTNGEQVHQTGYTSLVLPRAGYTPSKNPLKVTDKVDLTRSGLAQTTMSTISVTKNSAEIVTTRKKKRLSLPTSFFGSSGRSAAEAATPARLVDGLTQALSFTSSTPPPSKLHSGQVMVQVWAVALDAMDRLIVESKVNGENGGYGFIPGRSFVGRAVEVGWEVSSVQKGDWVMGLLELTKCGALAEFLVVDKRRVYPSPAPHGNLSLEQIALLPLWAVQSHRAVRTMVSSGVFSNPSSLEPKSALVLCRNVEGPPELAIQEMSRLGIDVTVQLPTSSTPRSDARAISSGAKKIVRGEPLEILQKLRESSFGFVLDFVGGKEVWKASRRVLRDVGSQFTTVVGDDPNLIPSVNAHVRSNLRSIRRAFTKKDSKSIGYEWVSPAADLDNEGEDVRDSLAVVGSMAQEGIIVPWSGGEREGKVVMFEKTPDLFAGTREEGLEAVIRIVD